MGGVNGAGKSTTISIMSGQLPKDSGHVTVAGADLDRDADVIKANIGVVYQATVLDQPLTVREKLECRAALYGITGRRFQARLEELSAMLELDPLLRRPVGKLSGGQRRRIDVARALLHQPRLLILDEPATGLDPRTRRLLWGVIGRLRREQGMTVFLTTHYMEEAADADYVVILDSGSIAAEGTPLELKNAYASDHITLFGVSPEQAAVLGCPAEATHDGSRISVGSTAAATELILRRPEMFVDYEITKGRMDDVFLAVTGKKLTEGGEGLQKVLACLPGTYGTVLLRRHAMRGVLEEMQSLGMTEEFMKPVRDALDCNLYFFGTQVSDAVLWIVPAASVTLLTLIFVLLNQSGKE